MKRFCLHAHALTASEAEARLIHFQNPEQAKSPEPEQYTDTEKMNLKELSESNAKHYEEEARKLVETIKQEDAEDADLPAAVRTLKEELDKRINDLKNPMLVNAAEYERLLDNVETVIGKLEAQVRYEKPEAKVDTYQDKMRTLWETVHLDAKELYAEVFGPEGKEEFALDLPEGWQIGIGNTEFQNISQARRRVIFSAKDMPAGTVTVTVPGRGSVEAGWTKEADGDIRIDLSGFVPVTKTAGRFDVTDADGRPEDVRKAGDDMSFGEKQEAIRLRREETDRAITTADSDYIRTLGVEFSKSDAADSVRRTIVLIDEERASPDTDDSRRAYLDIAKVQMQKLLQELVPTTTYAEHKVADTDGRPSEARDEVVA